MMGPLRIAGSSASVQQVDVWQRNVRKQLSGFKPDKSLTLGWVSARRKSSAGFTRAILQTCLNHSV
jgi:hypothetical protein